MSGIAAGCALFGAAAGLAAPASAEPIDGTYTAVISGPVSSMNQTWTFTSCGPDCRIMDNGGAVKELRLLGNTWTFSKTEDGVVCETTIDATTLAGSTGCGFMMFGVQLIRP